MSIRSNAVDSKACAVPVGESLEGKLRRVGNPAKMLRNAAGGRFKSPYPDQYTSWQDEQQGWTTTATLFDQSHHMTDVYFEGPDVRRLLSDTSTNSFRGYGRDRAKHLVVCAPDGNMIGTSVLFGLEEDQASLVGPVAAANWVAYQSEIGGYDVQVTVDERTRDRAGFPRRLFRFEIEGPAAMSILERVNNGPLESVPFFCMTHFDIAGVQVRALSHTMAGMPGAESMGMEIWGPVEQGMKVWDALLDAGADFGLVRGGMLAYYTGSIESGYAAQPTPAIYSGDDMRAYREWLPGNGYEGGLSVGGSYASDDVRDFYVTPWDFGYGHLVRFDHDFIGREALAASAEHPHRKKVWLSWNDDDVAGIYASSLFDGGRRAKYLDTPLARYARVMLDQVLVDGEPVGVSTLTGYTVNVGHWCSVAFVDEECVVDGTEVEVIWGEENGGTAKPNVERHAQTKVRAIVSSRPPVAG